MNRNFYCIRLLGVVLNNELQDALFDGAESLLRQKKNKIPFKGKGFEGQIRTTWKTVRIHALYGTQFIARIEHDKGSTEVEFLIRSPYDHALGKPPSRVDQN